MENPTSATGGTALELIATTCASQTCPTVFRTPSGSYVIQGYTVDPEHVGLTLPAGERLVEIPVDLLKSIQSS